VGPLQLMAFGMAVCDLQGTEGEGFLGLLLVEAIAQSLIYRTYQRQEEGMEVLSCEVAGRDGRSGLQVEDEAVGHIFIAVLEPEFA